ncbi:MAG: hypothetical protein MIL41_05045 [Hyphomicrobiales bacterium]|jgi:hypothetical protein
MPDQPAPRPGDAQHIAGFDHAVIHGGYGEFVDRWYAYANRDLLTVFADVDWLARDPLVDRYAKAFRGRSYPYMFRIFPTYAKAGNLVHWGLKLGILAEREVAGERGWALLHRTPVWAIDYSRPGRRLIQLIGAPPDVAAARAKRNAAREKLRATLDRKARFAFSISDPLNRILECDCGYVVPPKWAAYGPMPEWTVGRQLRTVFGIALDAHEVAGLTRQQLKRWNSIVEDGVAAAETRFLLFADQTPLPFEGEPKPAFHPDDAEALAGFADLGGKS